MLLLMTMLYTGPATFGAVIILTSLKVNVLTVVVDHPDLDIFSFGTGEFDMSRQALAQVQQRKTDGR